MQGPGDDEIEWRCNDEEGNRWQDRFDDVLVELRASSAELSARVAELTTKIDEVIRRSDEDRERRKNTMYIGLGLCSTFAVGVIGMGLELLIAKIRVLFHFISTSPPPIHWTMAWIIHALWILLNSKEVYLFLIVIFLCAHTAI